LTEAAALFLHLGLTGFGEAPILRHVPIFRHDFFGTVSLSKQEPINNKS